MSNSGTTHHSRNRKPNTSHTNNPHSNKSGPKDTATQSDTTPIPFDTLTQVLSSLGRFPWISNRKGNSSRARSIEHLQAWTDWDIQHDVAAGLAGLCVLQAPSTPGKPRPNKKSNVVAATLLLNENPRQWNLLCSGNEPLDTKKSSEGNFFEKSILMLNAISSAAMPLTNANNLASADVRAQHEPLATAENDFILWAYKCHLPKLQHRINKRGPQLERALETYMETNNLLGHDILSPLFGGLCDVNSLSSLDLKELKCDVGKIQQLHTASRHISKIIDGNTDLFMKLTENIEGGRSAYEVLEKVTTGATHVNNLVVLATCTELRQDLLRGSFQGPTFIKPSSVPKEFSPRSIDSTRLYKRFLAIRGDPPIQATDNQPQPLKIWRTLQNRVQSKHSINRTYVHCECIIAVEILNQGRKGKYYIGCPKLSCAPCSLFIKAVNEVGKRPEIGIEIVMEGTHGCWYLPWSIPPDTPGSVQEEFERYLLSWTNRMLKNDRKNNTKSNSDAAVDITPPNVL